MISLARIETPEQLAAQDAALLPAFDAQMPTRQKPDAHWLALDGAGQARARASLWWKQAPPHPTHRLGVIGHFAAADEEAARVLLGQAVEELGKQGCGLAVGPMDGNTWRRYRLVTERGSEPPFFLEPDNPDEWPRWFAGAGFSPLATYFSALSADLSVGDRRTPRAAERLERGGIRLRQIQPEHFTEELRRIYAVSEVSFRGAFLYTPITEPEFLAQYEPMRAHIVPELVLLAECEGRTVGFMFAVPDLLQAKRGLTVDTVILKTLAVLPGRAGAGLGGLLMARCHEAARALGYRRVIHALMHENNISLTLSGHYARPFRRYTLFARETKAANATGTV
jgi:GNAT superfamily N-acetyltransferase